jgi:cytochrome b involved in lipid metabolism
LISLAAVQAAHLQGQKLLCISNIIYDVSSFLPHHPGGRHLIKLNLGKDVTPEFNGIVYWHSNGARNLLHGMQVAKLDRPVGADVDGMKIEDELHRELQAFERGGKAKSS